MSKKDSYQNELARLRGIAAKRDMSDAGTREYLLQLQRVASAYQAMCGDETPARRCVVCGAALPERLGTLAKFCSKTCKDKHTLVRADKRKAVGA